MTRRDFPGAFYVDALPGGAWAAEYLDRHIETSAGVVPLPGENVLFLRMAMVGGRIALAGQGHTTGTAWLWHGLYQRWIDCGPTHGVSPCAWDVDGKLLYVVRNGSVVDALHPTDGGVFTSVYGAFGSQGIRWVRDGEIMSGDASYGDSARGLWEFTDFGDTAIGQGDAGVVAWLPHLPLRQVEPGGDCRFVRVNRTGDDFSIAFVHQGGPSAVIVWTTRDELAYLLGVTPPPQPPHPEPTPMIWTDAHTQLLERFAAKIPPPPPPDGQSHDSWDAAWRVWTGRVARQFCHTFGVGWGHKRADPNRPLSADCIAYKAVSVFAGFDLRNGTTFQLVTRPGQTDLAGQVFVAVEPVDALGTPLPTEPLPPEPTPVPSPETRLDRAITAFCRAWLGI